jgi:hypothetical protein
MGMGEGIKMGKRDHDIIRDFSLEQYCPIELSVMMESSISVLSSLEGASCSY